MLHPLGIDFLSVGRCSRCNGTGWITSPDDPSRPDRYDHPDFQYSESDFWWLSAILLSLIFLALICDYVGCY